MIHHIRVSLIVSIVSLMVISLFIGWLNFSAINAQEVVLFTSPLPTPTPLVSEYGRHALTYVAEKHDIPIEHLLIERDLETEYPLSGRAYRHILIAHTKDPNWSTYSVSVEMTTGLIEEDMRTIERAEEAAYLATYGRLSPSLYERLQQIADDTVLPVAIWAGGQPIWTEEEILAILVGEFSEAAEAVARGEKPIDVKNPETAQNIQVRYEELLGENVAARLRPFEEWQQQKGYALIPVEGMPSLVATLPKSAILELAQMQSVGMIYLLEEKSTLGMITAAASDRVPAVWSRGITGIGEKVAVLEHGIVDNTNCLNSVVTNPNQQSSPHPHTTKVANIIACTTEPKGIAHGADIVNANYTNNIWAQWNAVQALIWATQSPQNARIVNSSISFQANSNIEYTDRAFDYWAKARHLTVAVAAGNNGTYVTSPGKAWNVITVGGSNDQGTASWSDDNMWSGSGYINPSSGESGTDREKPEVVAPGVGITTLNGNSAEPDGTSYATPQVSGLAALLMKRNSQLRVWPEAVKAIIMASAVHNVDGPRNIDLSQDLKDGAGAINAALADQVAQLRQTSLTDPCNSLCWWGIHTSSSSPSVGSSLNRYFRATHGERIRVVISWMSNADSEANNYSFDRLDTNFDLRVYTQGGTMVKSSVSMKNNYELVEFVAPETTTYRIEVKKEAVYNNECCNSLAIAWTRQATFLPDVSGSNSGWTSSIIIRNDGAEDREVRVTYLNGTTTPTTLQMQPGTVATVQPPASYSGAAVVDGSEDLSVVVYTDGAARGSLDNGFLPQGAGDASFEQAGTVLYAPAFYKAAFNINSSVSIVNVGTEPTNVNVEFIGRSTITNGNFTHNILNIPAGSRMTVNGSHIQNGGNPWVGSLRLTSTGVGSSPAQPIVAMVNDDTTANPVYSRSYNATKFGSPLVYVPAAYRNQWGFNTGLVVQNLGTSTTNVTLTFCPRLVVNLSTECHPFTINNLESGKAQGVLLSNLSFLSNGWTGSVKLQTTTSGVPIAVAVTNSNSVGGYNFSATGRGGRTVYLPYAARNANGISTGYTVRNVSTSSDPITVQANFYNTSGTLRHTYSFDLGPAQVKGFAQILDGAFTQYESWQGSIVLQATGDIVAMMRADDGDAVSAYNGIVR